MWQGLRETLEGAHSVRSVTYYYILVIFLKSVSFMRRVACVSFITRRANWCHKI
jgi:hypothetical protein